MREGQRFTALDRKSGTVHATLDGAVFVAIHGGHLLYEVPGTDAGYGNRPLKTDDQEIRIVSLDEIAKLIFHGE